MNDLDMSQDSLQYRYRPLMPEEDHLVSKVIERSQAARAAIDGATLYVNFNRGKGSGGTESFTWCYLLSYRGRGKSTLRVGVTVLSGYDLFNGRDNQTWANNAALGRALRSEPVLTY